MSDRQLQKLNYTRSDFWEVRTITELHAQYYPVQKLQLIVSVPYIYNSEGNTVGYVHHHGNDNSTSTTTDYHGIGDPVLLAHYQLFNSMPSDSAMIQFSQRLMVGGGLKFPVGSWKLDDAVADDERVHQPGSGSWDFIASAVYLAKVNLTGLNVNASYKLTTKNAQSFAFGNSFNANAVVYYYVKIKDLICYPNIGAYFEMAGEDIADGYALQNSGGNILFAHGGLDFYFKKVSLSASIDIPAVQRLNDPQPEMKYRIISGISFAFN